MAIEQREVYLLPYPKNVNKDNHPFIVLSTKECNEYEQTFIAVMITSMEYIDDYSFSLKDEMFEDKLQKQGCHVRMHLVTLCLSSEVIGKRITRMKVPYFRQLMRSIGDLIFDYDFTPTNT